MRRAILLAAVGLLILIAVPAIAAQDKGGDKPGETDPGPYRAHGFSMSTDVGYASAYGGTYPYVQVQTNYNSPQYFACWSSGPDIVTPDIRRMGLDKLVVSGDYASEELHCNGSPPDRITFEFEIDTPTVIRVSESGSYRSQVLKGDADTWDYGYTSQYIQGFDGVVSGQLFGQTINETEWSHWEYTKSHDRDPNGPPASRPVSPPGKPSRGAVAGFLGSPFGAGGVGAAALLGLMGAMVLLSRAMGRHEREGFATR